MLEHQPGLPLARRPHAEQDRDDAGEGGRGRLHPAAIQRDQIGLSRVTSTQSRGASVRERDHHVGKQRHEGQPHRGGAKLAPRLQSAEEHLLVTGFDEREPVG